MRPRDPEPAAPFTAAMTATGQGVAGAKTDRRALRSRQALTAAFVELLLERGYANLTVGEVTERANVGRSTFYAHFAGLEGILKQSLARPSSHLVAIVGGEVTPEAVTPILIHFQSQRRLNRAMLTPPARGLWVRALAELIEPRLPPRPAGPAPRLPTGLIALQIAEGQIALVANWLLLRPSTAPEAVAAALIAVTRANLSALLD